MVGAFRRSELMPLRMENALLVPKGLRVLMRRSKIDQRGTDAISDRRRLPLKLLVGLWVAKAGNREDVLFRRLTKADRLTAKPMSDRGAAA